MLLLLPVSVGLYSLIWRTFVESALTARDGYPSHPLFCPPMTILLWLLIASTLALRHQFSSVQFDVSIWNEMHSDDEPSLASVCIMHLFYFLSESKLVLTIFVFKKTFFNTSRTNNRISRQFSSFTCQSVVWKRGLPQKPVHVLCSYLKSAFFFNLLCLCIMTACPHLWKCHKISALWGYLLLYNYIFTLPVHYFPVYWLMLVLLCIKKNCVTRSLHYEVTYSCTTTFLLFLYIIFLYID